MPRKRIVGRLPAHAACVGLFCAAFLVVASPAGATAAAKATGAAKATASAKAFVGQPAATAAPFAPGISIAHEDFDLPDPFILRVGGTYYMYLSSAYGNNTQNVPLLVGTPGHWSTQSIDAVPQMPWWAVGDPGAGGSGDGHLGVGLVQLDAREGDPGGAVCDDPVQSGGGRGARRGRREGKEPVHRQPTSTVVSQLT